jgi:ubiquinone/menaquinone biosynthesis C-methylase UbiE
MAGPFRAGGIRYEGTMSRDYDAARGLSPESARAWRDALEPYVAGVATTLDVGSGTGRFSVLLADWFGTRVVGIEPAPAMREIAARHGRVRYLAGRAEQIPLRARSVDVALLSNVYHHLVDRRAAAGEIHRVLRPGGRVLVRGAFAGRLQGLDLFDHFPEAKAVCEEFPTIEATVETFGRDFDLETIARVTAQTCASCARVDAVDFATESLVLYDRASAITEATLAFLLEGGVFPTIAIEIDQLEGVKELVRSGVGVAVVPRWAARREIAAGALAGVPVGPHGLRRTWALVFPDAQPRPATIASVVRLLADELPARFG